MALTKEEKFVLVQECVLEILSKGRDKLSVSRLARRAGVSRPWIYKNFGSKPDDLLSAAAKLVGERFAELDGKFRPQTLADLLEYFQAGAEQTLKDVERYPWIPKIYFDYFGDRGALGNAVRAVESTYVRKIIHLLAQFGIPRDEARVRVTASVKLRMSVSHAWCYDSEFRKLGPKAAVRVMMGPFERLTK